MSLDEWHPGVGPAEPRAFTTVGTWQNNGNDMEIKGETYYWSKHLNFRKVLEVAARANQPIEIATNLTAGADYERAIAGGFTIAPVVPMSLDIDDYREYVSASRGEFTVAKDIYVRPRTGWFSDRTVCYLAAGRPVVTQRTGFEKIRFRPARGCSDSTRRTRRSMRSRKSTPTIRGMRGRRARSRSSISTR